MNKVLLGMSGGKDSTWACRVLQSMGYEVEGLLLVLHSNAPVAQAEESARRLGIKLHIADRCEKFKRDVEMHFALEYLAGRTPNPCVECNYAVKLATLIEEADRFGIEKISTGHYVRVGRLGDRYIISRATDLNKDQSYFLWKLSQEMLSRLVSPLQDLMSNDVINSVKSERLLDSVKESQEICFIPDDDYVGFLKSTFTPLESKRAFSQGDFVTSDGKKVGVHKGYASYTVGQRKGLGVALGRPAYVTAIIPETNTVVIGFEEERARVEFTADSLNFVSVAPFEGVCEAFVRTRHRAPLTPCEVKIASGRAEFKAQVPVKISAPGQSAVFYDECGRVLFGGILQ